MIKISQLYKNRMMFALLGLFFINTVSFAAPQFEMPSTVLAKGDSEELAKECKALALKIDWLGRYQDHPTCTTALDGTKAYFASHYIAQNNTREAKPLLEEAIIKLNYAIDIQCYGQDDIQKVSDALQKILEQL